MPRMKGRSDWRFEPLELDTTKSGSALLQGAFLLCTSAYIPHLVPIRIYQRFFKYIDRNSNYIGDFLIISTIRHNISTYRQFPTSTPPYIPSPPIRKNNKTKKLSHICDSSFIVHMQLMLLKPLLHLNLPL